MYFIFEKSGSAFLALLEHRKNNPDCLDTHYESGKYMLYSEQDWEAAEAAFKFVIKKNPSYVRAYNRLGEVYFIQNRYQ